MRAQAFGNAQYLYMGVALIQFLKAFTPIVVTLVSAVLLGKHPSAPVVAALFVLCAGSSVTAAGDVSVTATGLLLACGSASTEAVRLVLTQFVLQDCRFSLWSVGVVLPLQPLLLVVCMGAFCLCLFLLLYCCVVSLLFSFSVLCTHSLCRAITMNP